MAGFEPRSSSVGNDHSANCATTISILTYFFVRGSVVFLPHCPPSRFLIETSVTSKKLPNVYNCCPKM